MSEKQIPGTGKSGRRRARRGSGSGNSQAPHVDRTVGMTPKQKQLYEAWVGLGGKLAQALRVLEEDEYLIIGIKKTNRFVQFAGQGAHGMRVETVSNYYLQEDERLGEKEHAVLLKLGWQAPSNLPDEFGHEPVGSPNYFLDLEQPLEFEAIAALAVNTLLGPLDADTPLDLEYSSFAESGESIRWPTLGLRRATA